MPSVIPQDVPDLYERPKHGPYGHPGSREHGIAKFDRAQAMIGIFQGRIEVDAASTARLQLKRYNGKWIEVNGELVEIPIQSDIDNLTGEGSLFVVRNTDAIIQPEGGITGTAIAASTLHYVYVCNSQGAGASVRRVRCSIDEPTARDTDGIRYLSDRGQGRHWRFVGYVRPNASTQFIDTTADRLVCNWHNRIRKSILLQPGYVDDGAVTSYTSSSTVWTPANGGTGATGSYIANGEDSVHFHATASYDSPGGFIARVGIGHDSSTTAYSSVQSAALGDKTRGDACSMAIIPSEGYRTVALLVNVSGGAGLFFSDYDRAGGVTDPRATFLCGTVAV